MYLFIEYKFDFYKQWFLTLLEYMKQNYQIYYLIYILIFNFLKYILSKKY